MFQLQIEDFVEACQRKRSPCVSGRQGVESTSRVVGEFERQIAALVVCTENPVRVDDVMESPKLAG